MTRTGWLAALPVLVLIAVACNSDTDPVEPGSSGPPAPVWLYLSMTSPDSIRLEWNDASIGESGFEVLRSTRAGEGYAPIDSVAADGTRFTDTSVSSGQRYYYRVRAYDQLNRYGEQTPAVWGVATANEPPIFDLDAVSPANGALGLVAVEQLNWSVSDPDDEPVFCRLYYSDSRGDLEQNELTSADTATVYTLLTAPEFTRSYYWRVAASDAQGATTLSPYFNFVMKIEHVDVQAGEFVLGDCGLFHEADIESFCPEERIASVADFNIDKYEVSNQLFAQFLQDLYDELRVVIDGGLVWTNTDPATRELYAKLYPDGDEHAGITFEPTLGARGTFLPRAGRENHPMVEVTWRGAVAFALRIGRDLPTEHQWEKAARGTASTLGEIEMVGVGSPYPWGADPDARRFNYSGSGDPFDGRVGVGTTEGGYYNGESRSGYGTRDGASPYGAYDLAGNVAEWCLDVFAPYQGGANANMRVVKGGGWRSSAIACQTFWREAAFPDSSDNNLGFRTVAPGLAGGY